MGNEDYLRKLVNEGIKKKYNLSKNINLELVPGEELTPIEDSNSEFYVIKALKERVGHELDVIAKNNFTDYFLLVYDIIHFAKTNNIPVGPGRGASVGSIVLYALDVTDIDPIKYGLFFERFINEEKIVMPDIDIDVSLDGRDKIIEYLKTKNGDDNVMYITTFGRVNAKNLLRNPKDTMDILIDTANKLDNVVRVVSVHESGLCVTPNNVLKQIPIRKANKIITDKSIDKTNNCLNKIQICTQYDMHALDNLGYWKQDILGLKALDEIKNCIEKVKSDKEIDIDLNRISYEDEKVYNMISNGDTEDVSGLGSEGMIEFIKDLKPNKFTDLVLAISVYRPGPDKYIDELVKRKNNPQLIERIQPLYDYILVETYGKIIYQEQIMEILNKLSGMNLNRADIVRRSLSKKKNNEIINAKKEFIYGDINFNGCINNEISEEIAKLIFDNLLESSAYAFNKSHAVACAKLAYQMAYLKCYYKEEFMKSIIKNSITKI